MRTYLSLFNGVGVGSQALKDLCIKVDKTYVSEINFYANITNEKNHPNSIQLGDVTKWRDWDIDWSTVDLVTAGFPCQAWSMAGQQQGDKDPRGALFWTTLEVISHVLKCNPSAKWLMENVKMKREFEEYITFHTSEALGHVEKILINSALVTAQNRNRWYWSNFKIEQPEDWGIVLGDIIENCDGIYQKPRGFNKGGVVNNGLKSSTITRNCWHENNMVITNVNPSGRGMNGNVYNINSEKSPTLTTNKGEGIKIGAIRGRYVVDGVRQDHKMLTAGKTTQRLELRSDDKSNTLTTVQKDNVLVNDELHYRKLTPLECERLQGFPDGYTEGVSNTQRYIQIGNAWTLPVIRHIFTFI